MTDEHAYAYPYPLRGTLLDKIVWLKEHGSTLRMECTDEGKSQWHVTWVSHHTRYHASRAALGLALDILATTAQTSLMPNAMNDASPVA
jgi:hypothetical protein